MKLYVARHTQTNYNVKKLCNADPSVDVHLTELGKEQSRQLAEQLAGIPFDVIYISELPRTRETASYLQQYPTTKIIVDSRLNDNATGFESKSVNDYLAAFNSSKDKWYAKFNDGESLAEVKQRVENFIQDLKAHNYDSVLIVTHGYIAECINAIINNLDFETAAALQVTQGDYRLYELTVS